MVLVLCRIYDNYCDDDDDPAKTRAMMNIDVHCILSFVVYTTRFPNAACVFLRWGVAIDIVHAWLGWLASRTEKNERL